MFSAPATAKLGRVDELAALDEALGRSAEAVVISAVNGSGGIGKTALCLNLRGYDPVSQPMEAFQLSRGEMPRDVDARLARALLATGRT
ncbi:hypothetical protein KALB_2475 [Kutzneria albida DSM 43870]|uniref:Uncharacterized protein n=1 Tax=Kutzneria albida DSM 43870 TaxID=1449976 RepID=W5W3P9_9PSEU|nr:hypothetical protein KALB_2475 [Kutzneria albida DSM 43870]